MFRLKRIYQAILLSAAAWAVIVVSISLIFGEKFLFLPSEISASETELALRGEVLRLSLFLLFAYFSLLHIISEKKRISSGHVLISIMTCLTFVGTWKLIMSGNLSSDRFFVPVFATAALIIFLGSRPRVRRYFRRRN